MEVKELCRADLRQIYEKTLTLMVDRMIEISENEYEMHLSTDDLKTTVRFVILALHQRFPEIIPLQKEERFPHIRHNMLLLEKMASEEAETATAYFA